MSSRNGPRLRARPGSSRSKETVLPWMTANQISVHYDIAGEGPAVVLLHEMGGTLDSRAGLAEREGMRAALSVTLDKSWPAEIGERARYETYRARYLACDP